jgi:hypothetical protein
MATGPVVFEISTFNGVHLLFWRTVHMPFLLINYNFVINSLSIVFLSCFQEHVLKYCFQEHVLKYFFQEHVLKYYNMFEKWVQIPD